jgi:5-methyltetrahydropteroyltriglutamate--homocysteine methyltransferase
VIETTVVGSYPKPPPGGQAFTLRKTLHAREREEASEKDLQRVRDELTTEMIREQELAGIDLITDGHARWDDLLTPFAAKLNGFEIGGLLRWFDNNVYYRRPVCVNAVEWREPISVRDFEFASSVAKRPVKAVIPGPITLARLSMDEYYGQHDTFVTAISEALAREAAELEAAGAQAIQIDEPALLGAPEDLPLARDAIGTVVSRLGVAETTLGTYFGDAKTLGKELFELPVDVFSLDFVSGPDNRELIEDLPSSKKLQAGIVDARNTRLEDLAALGATIEDLTTVVGRDRLRLAPSAGLEFLPREKARSKLERLVEAARKGGD